MFIQIPSVKHNISLVWKFRPEIYLEETCESLRHEVEKIEQYWLES
ncbi:hypothetical protein HanIR_Chr01g0031201 [Helianthus annuus]|nr:hypothetical protein HanIR_Chr01g0031201 [Helianthus annuus]